MLRVLLLSTALAFPVSACAWIHGSTSPTNLLIAGSGWGTFPTAQPATEGTGSTDPVVANFDIPQFQATSGVILFGVDAAHISNIGGGVYAYDVAYVQCSDNDGSWVTVSTPSYNPDSGGTDYVFASPPGEVRCIVFPTNGIPTVLQGAVHSPGDIIGFITPGANPYLTVTTSLSGSSIKAGLRINNLIAGVAPNTTITDISGTLVCGLSTCSGTGGAGTYPVNISQTVGGANITASISGSTLDVTAFNNSGQPLMLGSVIRLDASPFTAYGVIAGFLTGSGGIGEYTLSLTQQTAIPTTTMDGLIPMLAGAESSLFIAPAVASPALVYVNSVSGSDATGCGADDISADACATIEGAFASANTIHPGDLSGAVVCLEAGNYSWGNATATSYAAVSTYITIEPCAGVPASSVVITSSGSASGLRAGKIHVKGLYTTVQLTSATLAGVANNELTALWIDDVNYVGPGEQFANSFVASTGFTGGMFTTGSSISNSAQGAPYQNLVTTTNMTNLSENPFQGDYTMIADTVANLSYWLYGSVNGAVSTVTGDLTSGSYCISNLSETADFLPGGVVFQDESQLGAAIPANTTVAVTNTCGAGEVTMSAKASSSVTDARIGGGFHGDLWLNQFPVAENILMDKVTAVAITVGAGVGPQMWYQEKASTGDMAFGASIAVINSQITSWGTSAVSQLASPVLNEIWYGDTWSGPISFSSIYGFTPTDFYILNNVCSVAPAGYSGSGITYYQSPLC